MRWSPICSCLDSISPPWIMWYAVLMEMAFGATRCTVLSCITPSTQAPLWPAIAEFISQHATFTCEHHAYGLMSVYLKSVNLNSAPISLSSFTGYLWSLQHIHIEILHSKLRNLSKMHQKNSKSEFSF